MTKKVILISGKLQSGKNTFSDFLIEELKNYHTIDYDFFAKPLKDECKEVFGVLVDYLNTIAKKHNVPELQTLECNWYENKNELTRILLQTYGTNIFRDLVDKDWWAKKLSDKIKSRSEDIIVVTDVRFKSEIAIIDNSDFIVKKIRIERPNYKRDNNPIHKHISETELDCYNGWNKVVYNDETLDVLKQIATQYAKEISVEFSVL